MTETVAGVVAERLGLDGGAASPGARLLHGAPVAAGIRARVKADVTAFRNRHGFAPTLAVVVVGKDAPSAVYLQQIIRSCRNVGVSGRLVELTGRASAEELREHIEQLNADPEVTGILLQLPAPPQVDGDEMTALIDPLKDVDGLTPVNAGLLQQGKPGMVPCTPLGVMELLNEYRVEVAGRRAVVIGRSAIVGKPMALLLMQKWPGGNATVTVAHTGTRDLAAQTRRADILVVAIGRPGFVRGEHVKPGATVIDVGMNRVTDAEEVKALFGEDAPRRLETLAKRGYTLVGDVHPAEVERVAGRLTPVPGGVGLLTVAMLMKNTVKAARLRRGL